MREREREEREEEKPRKNFRVEKTLTSSFKTLDHFQAIGIILSRVKRIDKFFFLAGSSFVSKLFSFCFFLSFGFGGFFRFGDPFFAHFWRFFFLHLPQVPLLQWVLGLRLNSFLRF